MIKPEIIRKAKEIIRVLGVKAVVSDCVGWIIFPQVPKLIYAPLRSFPYAWESIWGGYRLPNQSLPPWPDDWRMSLITADTPEEASNVPNSL